MAYYYREIQAREQQSRDDLQARVDEKRRALATATVAESASGAGYPYAEDPTVSPSRHRSRGGAEVNSAMLSPPAPHHDDTGCSTATSRQLWGKENETDESVDEDGAPVARLSPPVPIPSPIREPTNASNDGHWCEQPRNLSQSVPTTQPRFEKRSRATSSYQKMPNAHSASAHSSAMQRILKEEAARRTQRAKQRSSSPFRSNSPRFGIKPPTGAKAASAYDAAYYVQPKDSRNHDFYVAPSSFTEKPAPRSPRRSLVSTDGLPFSASPSRTNGGTSSPSRYMHDDEPPRRAVRSSRWDGAPARFGPALYHADGMISPRTDTAPGAHASPAMNTSVVENGDHQRSPREPKVVSSSLRSPVSARPRSPTTTTSSGVPRGRPLSPSASQANRPRSSTPTDGQNRRRLDPSTSNTNRSYSPLSPHVLLNRPKQAKKKSVMEGAPPRFGAVVSHGKGLISPVPSKYH